MVSGMKISSPFTLFMKKMSLPTAKHGIRAYLRVKICQNVLLIDYIGIFPEVSRAYVAKFILIVYYSFSGKAALPALLKEGEFYSSPILKLFRSMPP
jgi:hypothetical protein